MDEQSILSSMSLTNASLQLTQLPCDLIAHVLSFVGHVRWLQSTRAASKLLHRIAQDIMSKRALRLDPTLRSYAKRGLAKAFAYNRVGEQVRVGQSMRYITLYRPLKLYRNKTGALIAYVKAQEEGSGPSGILAWHRGYDVTSACDKFEELEPSFSFEGVADDGVFGDTLGEMNESRLWYNCGRPMLSFVLPANNHMYATEMEKDYVGRINLDTGDVAFQETEYLCIGGAERIEVSPDGKRAAFVYTEMRQIGRSRCAMSVIQVYQGEEDGTLVHVGSSTTTGAISHFSYLSSWRTNEDMFLCNYRTELRLDGVTHHNSTYGSVLLSLGRSRGGIVTANNTRRVGAVELPDGRLVGCACDKLEPQRMQIVVWSRGLFPSLVKRTELFDRYAHDFYPEAAFGADWWPANAKCGMIVPLNAAHVVFELLVGETVVSDGEAGWPGGLTLVDVALQQRLRVISMPSRFFKSSLARIPVRCHEIFVRPDGRLLVRVGSSHNAHCVLLCVDTGLLQH